MDGYHRPSPRDDSVKRREFDDNPKIELIADNPAARLKVAVQSQPDLLQVAVTYHFTNLYPNKSMLGSWAKLQLSSPISKQRALGAGPMRSEIDTTHGSHPASWILSRQHHQQHHLFRCCGGYCSSAGGVLDLGSLSISLPYVPNFYRS